MNITTSSARERRALIAKLLTVASSRTSLWLATVEAMSRECRAEGRAFDVPAVDDCVIDVSNGTVCVLSETHGTRVYRRVGDRMDRVPDVSVWVPLDVSTEKLRRFCEEAAGYASVGVDGYREVLAEIDRELERRANEEAKVQ